MIAPQETSEETAPQGFRFFKAGWRPDDALPESWYMQHISRKPRFHALFWAPEAADDRVAASVCKNNATGFQQLISLLNTHNLKAYQVSAELSVDRFTRQAAIAQLDRLSELKSGDCCLLFFSGVGIFNESIKQSTGDQYVCEPLFAGDLPGDKNMVSIRKKLGEVTFGKGIHVFTILDYHRVVAGELVPAAFVPSDSSFVVLESPVIESSNIDNFFYEQLADIIQTTGAKMRYANLLSRLELRYLQSELSARPTMLSLPPSFYHAYIFSGIFSGKSDYKVFFHEQQKEWQINAGILHGILPSLSFMHTEFLLDDGRKVTVYNTFDSYSTLLNFDEQDTENTYDAHLLQNALPKMKVGFHENIEPRMKQQFEETVSAFDIYFIDLLENRQQVDFLIKNRNEEYYLVRHSGYMGDHDNRPVFFYQHNVREFIKQLEYIAQWQALLELENARSSARTEDVDIRFEIIEGLEVEPETADKLPAVIQANPTGLTLRYRNQKPPFMRCSVANKSGSPGADYFVNFLYLDSSFGISQFECIGSDKIKPGEQVYASFSEGSEQLKSIELQLQSFYLENGIREIQDYLLVFLSAQPLDVAPLTQSGLEIHEVQVSRSVSLEEARQSFVLPQGDWFVKKIPIRVVYDDRSFEQTVQELVDKHPVTVPDDPQKDRWGGKASQQGYELSAEVKANLPFPGSFAVTLQVTKSGLEQAEGDVAFLLHDSFQHPIQLKKFSGGKASTTVWAYEDFTAAAILYDGTTLELDLSTIAGFPRDFYARKDSEFSKKVQAVLQETPVKIPGDLQKNRWGSRSEAAGKKISATVTAYRDTHLVNLLVQSTGDTPLTGKVAFLLHDSFSEPTVYREAVDGKATYALHSYEAFTVGAYLEDGTRLELDLNEQKGYPKDFYY